MKVSLPLVKRSVSLLMLFESLNPKVTLIIVLSPVEDMVAGWTSVPSVLR